MIYGSLECCVSTWIFSRLRGGAKKRKKKNYTTPKKIKHKHRKVKSAVLKYYKARVENKSS